MTYICIHDDPYAARRKPLYSLLLVPWLFVSPRAPHSQMLRSRALFAHDTNPVPNTVTPTPDMSLKAPGSPGMKSD